MKGGLNMIYNSKGLSAVVTTLIIILLSLVAIGIIWVVVNNVLQGGAETTEIGAKCLQVDIKATAANCTGGTCTITYYRAGTGNDVIDGVKIVLNNGTESDSSDEAALDRLATKTATFTTTLANPNSVEIAAYFVDASGQQQVCAAGTTVTFS